MNVRFQLAQDPATDEVDVRFHLALGPVPGEVDARFDPVGSFVVSGFMIIFRSGFMIIFRITTKTRIADS